MLLKNFKAFAEGFTRQIRQATEAGAIAAGRPMRYLNGFVDKEALVRRIREEQGTAAGGLIAVLSALEGCCSYAVYRNRDTHRIELRRRPGRCLHYYFYWLDERFGLTQWRSIIFGLQACRSSRTSNVRGRTCTTAAACAIYTSRAGGRSMLS